MVAKTFQTMTQLGEPYEVNGKSYVQVRNEKTGTVRQVRWYTQKEYEKLYPDEKSTPTVSSNAVKKILGFEKGFITIFSGAIEANEEWFNRSIARYHRMWGWYIVSTDELPKDMPSTVTPVVLPWDLVGNPDGSLKTSTAIDEVISNLLYEEHSSQFVGSVGERIEVSITVTKNIQLDGQFGQSNMHIMEDANQNVFVWTTASKNWPVGSEKTIRGTVKQHNIYQNQKQTILTRCIERG